jgi:hypothetical protein
MEISLRDESTPNNSTTGCGWRRVVEFVLASPGATSSSRSLRLSRRPSLDSALQNIENTTSNKLIFHFLMWNKLRKVSEKIKDGKIV